MPDRKKQPPFQKSISFQLKKPEVLHHPGKAPLFILHGGEQEIIRIEFVFAAGKWFETTPGLSDFSSALLTKGTSSLSGKEIASMLEELGYHVETGSSADFTHLAISGLRKNFKPALEIIKSCLKDPAFPEHELQQQKDIFIQQLQVNRERTSYLASRLFREQIFGKDHPYAAEADETRISQLTRAEVADYYARQYSDFAVFLTGKTDDVIRESVTGLVEQLNWQAHANPEHQISPNKNKKVSQSRSKAVQSSVRIGKITIPRNHPDFPRLAFASYLLGGYFGSRLMKVIREEKGLTYGIYSSIRSHKNATVFSVSADVNRNQAESVIEEILNQMKDLRTRAVQQKELDLAKNHFIGSLQNEMTNIFAHMERFKTMYLFDLPQDYYNELIQKIDSAKAEDIIAVMESHLHEEGMTIAMAG